jgi:AcrR family transcriptional regulator
LLNLSDVMFFDNPVKPVKRSISLDKSRKLRILDAAKKKFEYYGFKKTTVDEIAEEAGISKRTIYETFSSKEKILSELVIAEALKSRKLVLSQLKAVEDPFKKLLLFIELAANYFLDNPFLGKVLNDEERLFSPFLSDEIGVIESGLQQIFHDILQEGIDQGIFREMNINTASRCVFILFRNFSYGDTTKHSQEWTTFIQNALRK